VPELPEVEALAAYLRERAVGHRVERIDVAAISALKTYDPPPSAVAGREVVGAGRHGKFLDVEFSGGLHLITHLARAGWLHYRDSFPSTTPLKPGKGPIALRVRLDDGSGFDLTEAGTKRSLAAYLVTDPKTVPGVARLGPDALAADRETFAARIRSRRGQLKGVLTDQEILAGIGNAYSDEILHAAKLSPFAMSDKLTEPQMDALYEAVQSVESDAVARSVGQKAARLKGEKRSGFKVHARTGLPCPVCGDAVREVSFADSSLQYCPTCQTGGKPLADRRLSRLVR
jgi:formamidopyrimidine-DNA glycosylase